MVTLPPIRRRPPRRDPRSAGAVPGATSHRHRRRAHLHRRVERHPPADRVARPRHACGAHAVPCPTHRGAVSVGDPASGRAGLQRLAHHARVRGRGGAEGHRGGAHRHPSARDRALAHGAVRADHPGVHAVLLPDGWGAGRARHERPRQRGARVRPAQAVDAVGPAADAGMDGVRTGSRTVDSEQSSQPRFLQSVSIASMSPRRGMRSRTSASRRRCRTGCARTPGGSDRTCG
jgi:hypothetical protein